MFTMSKERVAVYIDGSNFYHKIKSGKFDIRNLSKFDFRGLVRCLAHEREITTTLYYIGVVRALPDDSRGQQLRRNQQRLFSHLESPFQNFTVKKGYMMQNRGIFVEKGVDVQIAVDMVVGAFQDDFDTAMLVSSDTDLIPAIKQVKLLGKRVEYIGFAHQPSFGIRKHATAQKLLIKKDILPFAKSTLKNT